MDDQDYLAAAETLEGVAQVFLDGDVILLPESERDAIELPRSRSKAAIVFTGRRYILRAWKLNKLF